MEKSEENAISEKAVRNIVILSKKNTSFDGDSTIKHTEKVKEAKGDNEKVNYI